MTRQARSRASSNLDDLAMKAALERYVEAVNAGQADVIAAMFALGACLEDPVGSPAKLGRDAIEAFYRAALAAGARMEIDGGSRLPRRRGRLRVSRHPSGRDTERRRRDYVDTGGGPGTMLEVLKLPDAAKAAFAHMSAVARSWDGADPLRGRGK